MLHLHNLDHVQVNGFPPFVLSIYDRRVLVSVAICTDGTRRTFGGRRRTDSEDSIYDISGKLLRKGSVDFGSKRGVRDVDECRAVELHRLLERIQELHTTRHDTAQTYRATLRTARASFFAKSKPSAMTVGCTPSEM